MVSRAAVLGVFQSYVGIMERTGNNDVRFNDEWGLGSGPDAAWCFAMVESGFSEAGAPLPLVSFHCPTGVAWSRANGQSIEVEQAHLVIPGDIPFFSWDMENWGRWTPGTGDHVAVVEAVDGDALYTIEGNVGPRDGVSRPQGVHRRVRSISGTVVNFWRPPVFDDSPLTISQPEDDMFDETTDRAALQQTAAAAQSLVAAVAVVDNLLRDTFNNAAGANGGIAGITPTVQDGYNHAVWTWEKLKDVDFAALGSAPDSPPAADPSERLESLERRFTALEQAIARLAGPRPPVASPTAPPASA